MEDRKTMCEVYSQSKTEGATVSAPVVASGDPWTPGPYPFGFSHVRGFSNVPRLAVLEAGGWVRVGQVPGLTAGVWVMKRAVAN
jgi:hypothetical protein